MIRQKRPALVIAFDSTTQALAAEALFTQRGLPGRMIPLPAQVAAGCGLAWKAEPVQEAQLLAALADAGCGHARCAVVELFA